MGSGADGDSNISAVVVLAGPVSYEGEEGIVLLYLVHRRTGDGRPVGIWSSPEEFFYEEGAGEYQETGARLVGSRRHFPWDEIVDRLVGTANRRHLFADVEDDNPDMVDLLREIQAPFDGQQSEGRDGSPSS